MNKWKGALGGTKAGLKAEEDDTTFIISVLREVGEDREDRKLE